jgi:predicted TIM-barrel fold metal-dependent hydrolase
MGRFCGQSFYEGKDKELSLLCVRAYNDWMIDEWSGRAPGRFIPLIIIPLWDTALAVAEIERTAAKGAKAIAFSENPVPLGLPSIHHSSRYWEPVFAAASDTGMPLCTHFGSSSTVVKTSADTPMIATIAMNPTSLALSCIDWLFSGILPRHPGLKICLSEGGIGWIPWVLERCDHTQDVQRYWASSGRFEGDLQEGVSAAVTSGLEDPGSEDPGDFSFIPSELFRAHVYGCFIDEPFGAGVIEWIGVDNVMVESDYPHTDSTWPHSADVVLKQIDHLTPADQRKVLRGNAERVFNFQAAELPLPQR